MHSFNLDCGESSFSGREGLVTSPESTLSYPHDLSCTYSIDIGRNNSVLLKFLNFDLESSTHYHDYNYDDTDNNDNICTRDWLTVSGNY